jgi:hypothetical protein
MEQEILAEAVVVVVDLLRLRDLAQVQEIAIPVVLKPFLIRPLCAP